MLAPKYQKLSPCSERRIQPFEINPYDLSVEIEHVLGKDGNSVIYRGLLRSIKSNKSSYSQVAIKISYPPITPKSRKAVANEIQALKTLKHNSHILSMVGYMNTETDLMIVSEFCQLGHLGGLIQSHPCHYANQELCSTVICFNAEELLSFFWQIADGLSFMTANEILHRDIAAENIFITDNMVAKVGGFKRCMIKRQIGDHDEELPFWNQAVETLLKGEYSEKSDVWQFGNLLFEVFSGGSLPFGDLSKEQIIQMFAENERPRPVRACPDIVSDLIDQCWKTDVDRRPSFSQLKSLIAATFIKSRSPKSSGSLR
ncbi:unnamed protein product [Bursaphelenchus xylophilus]|uniref:(pine wood nematode) hypothetical protein n=1 Tax=Bursaphelenchus xylophilus TaxID=6326 RepID=A0A1I7S3J7_BURXY|nr:unnamed protein product [Bursaphelenchus xylophilus]CAG9116356.1 unnamed protein product [Bursaphelenchus xylophilus]